MFVFSGAKPAILRDRGDFLEYEHFDVLCTAYKRRVPQGKILVFFLQDTLKTAF